jgi:hypothetical protein
VGTIADSSLRKVGFYGVKKELMGFNRAAGNIAKCFNGAVDLGTEEEGLGL